MDFSRLNVARHSSALVTLAQRTLGMTHEEFGAALGVSKRTAARIAAGQSGILPSSYAELARLVLPRDPELAAQLASEAGGTLESLGLVQRSRASTAHLVDAVVCVAAEALGSTAGVRAAVHAAFRRAREMGLTMEDVESALAPAREVKAPKPRA